MAISDQVEEGFRRDLSTLHRTINKDEGLFPIGPSTAPSLVVLTGLPGTGKSYFARALARHASFLVLESDRLRKALVSRPKYTRGENSRLFSACHRLIEEYLAEGRRVVFDATNLRESHRRPLYDLADRLGVPLVVVRFTAPDETIRRRLAARASQVNADDYSDADWRVYRRMLSHEEPISREHLVVDSSEGATWGLEEIVRLVHAAK